MKAVLLAGLMTLGSVSAYAAADYNSSVPMSEETQASQEAITEGLIPADQLDAVEYQTVAPEAVDTQALPPGDHRGGDRRGGDRHDRPMPFPGRDDRRGGDHRDHRRRWPFPRPFPRPAREWSCSARDRVRVTYTARSWDLYSARRGAMAQCQMHSFVQGCRLLGCARY